MHGHAAKVCSWLRAGVQAQQLRAAQAQYKEAREQLKRGLQAAEAALLRGAAPSTLALQPALRLPFVPSTGTGAGAGGAAVSRLSHQVIHRYLRNRPAFSRLGESELSMHQGRLDVCVCDLILGGCEGAEVMSGLILCVWSRHRGWAGLQMAGMSRRMAPPPRRPGRGNAAAAAARLAATARHGAMSNSTMLRRPGACVEPVRTPHHRARNA